MKDKELVKDLVCGMVKAKEQMKARSIFKGKVYYFCTAQDKELFEAYPDHWLPKQSDK